MNAVVRLVASSSDPASPAAAPFRAGLSSARRELRAGTARRHRADVARAGASDANRRAADLTAPAHSSAPIDDSAAPPSDGLAIQRAGVRAALAELRQHRANRGNADAEDQEVPRAR